MKTPARQPTRRYPLGSSEALGWLAESIDDIMDRINDIPNTGTVALTAPVEEKPCDCVLCERDLLS